MMAERTHEESWEDTGKDRGFRGILLPQGSQQGTSEAPAVSEKGLAGIEQETACVRRA
jgi:hypothetical protein